jgi:hypothetical protein
MYASNFNKYSASSMTKIWESGGIFYEAFSIHHWMVGWYMNDDLEGIWKEVIVNYVGYYSSTCFEELQKRLDKRCPEGDSNRVYS